MTDYQQNENVEKAVNALTDDAAGVLCKTCSQFNWTRCLQSERDIGFILHHHFKNVFRGAAAGCRLCSFIVKSYEEVASKGVIPGSNNYHLRCRIVISKAPALWNPTLRVDNLIVRLSIPADKSSISLWSTSLGISAPYRKPHDNYYPYCKSLMFVTYWEVLQQYCEARSFICSSDTSVDHFSLRLKWMASLIADCCNQAGHQSCPKWPHKNAPDLPTRLIDCHQLRLIESKELKIERERSQKEPGRF